MATRIFDVLVPVAYAGATLAYLVLFVRNRRAPSRITSVALGTALSAGMAAVAIRARGSGHVPLAGPGEALAFFALGTLCVYAWLELRTRTQALGIFFAGIALVFQILASVLSTGFTSVPLELESGWFAVHAITSVVSFCAFSIAAVTSTMYLLLYRELHGGRPGYIYRRIPSLETLDATARRAVAFGMALLSTGIVSGAVWAHEAWGRYWSWDPKQCSAFTVWLLYGTYLLLRRRHGWPGRRVAYFAVVGFALLVFTFIVVERVFDTAHHFG